MIALGSDDETASGVLILDDVDVRDPDPCGFGLDETGVITNEVEVLDP